MKGIVVTSDQKHHMMMKSRLDRWEHFRLLRRIQKDTISKERQTKYQKRLSKVKSKPFSLNFIFDPCLDDPINLNIGDLKI